MRSLIVKKVLSKDISHLQKISIETFLQTYAAGNTEEDMQQYLKEEFEFKKLISELNDPNSAFYFALLEDEIIGYLKINFGQAQTDIKDEKSIEIQRIYVREEYQGKKIGKALYL